MTTRRIACVVVPEGYKDEAEFAADCSLEIVKPAGLMREMGELCEDVERHIKITTDQQHEIERLREALERVADHDLKHPGLHYPSLEFVIESAVGIAKQALANT